MYCYIGSLTSEIMGRVRRFVGLDVHQETTSICVRNRDGKIVRECVIPTTTAAIRRVFRWRSGTAVTFEECPLAAWLYRLLQGRAEQIVVCNPRYNRLLRSGSKNDRIDGKAFRIATPRRIAPGPSRARVVRPARSWLPI